MFASSSSGIEEGNSPRLNLKVFHINHYYQYLLTINGKHHQPLEFMHDC
jgi:hypothetical protein